jgi:hypothetical protein
MQEDNIIKAIPYLLTDVSEFTLTKEPTEEELEIILSYGFMFMSKIVTTNGTYYTFRRRYYEY